MDQPLVSVVIPVGPRHVQHCRVAAASALGQSIGHHQIEIVVVPDAEADVGKLAHCTVLPMPSSRQGPARTRNRGIAVARGQFVTFLDADDYFMPRGLEHLLRAYSEGAHGYTYGNTYTMERDGHFMLRSAPDYSQDDLRRYNIHVVTALVPLKSVIAAGGFDEGVDAWEDWTIWLRLAQRGVCGYRTAHPVFVYRVYEGDRMTRWYGGERALVDAVIARYQNAQGVIEMASCCGGDAALARTAAQGLNGIPLPEPIGVGEGMVRIEFLGEEKGAIPLEISPGRIIRLGNNASNRYADVTVAEAAWIAERLNVRTVPKFDPPAPPPDPLPILTAADVLTPATDRPALRPRGRQVRA